MDHLLGRIRHETRSADGSILFECRYNARRDAANYFIAILILSAVLPVYLSGFHVSQGGQAVVAAVVGLAIWALWPALVGRRTANGMYLNAPAGKLSWWDSDAHTPHHEIDLHDLRATSVVRFEDTAGNGVGIDFLRLTMADGATFDLPQICLPEPSVDVATRIIELAPSAERVVRSV